MMDGNQDNTIGGEAYTMEVRATVRFSPQLPPGKKRGGGKDKGCHEKGMEANVMDREQDWTHGAEAKTHDVRSKIPKPSASAEAANRIPHYMHALLTWHNTSCLSASTGLGLSLVFLSPCPSLYFSPSPHVNSAPAEKRATTSTKPGLSPTPPDAPSPDAPAPAPAAGSCPLHGESERVSMMSTMAAVCHTPQDTRVVRCPCRASTSLGLLKLLQNGNVMERDRMVTQ